MKDCVIILAAGIGNRFKNAFPKQFNVLGDLPIVMHTINAYYHSTLGPDIFLVLSDQKIEYWNKLCKEYDFDVPHKIISGGSERFHSVKNALDKIDGYDFVGIHDGVRPFVTDDVISRAFDTAHKLGNATPAVPATNTIRFYDQVNFSNALDREKIYIIQNPQVFKFHEIKSAYTQKFIRLFTDDATVAEHYGMKINLVEGDRVNIKITHPIDIAIAQAIFSHKNKQNIDPIEQIYN
jgi:2-C-methyl-D-erythritol 4-phosphate cytidylyltransferase